MTYNNDTKSFDVGSLRKNLLDEVYTITFSGSGTAILDEHKIRGSNAGELIEIGKEYGFEFRFRGSR